MLVRGGGLRGTVSGGLTSGALSRVRVWLVRNGTRPSGPSDGGCTGYRRHCRRLAMYSRGGGYEDVP